MTTDSPASKRVTTPAISAEKKAEIAEEMAEQMVRGWSYITQREWQKRLNAEYGVKKETFVRIERIARSILTDSFSAVNRQDLVAQYLHRLELIQTEAIKFRQSSVAQAAIATALRAVGADAPPKD